MYHPYAFIIECIKGKAFLDIGPLSHPLTTAN